MEDLEHYRGEILRTRVSLDWLQGVHLLWDRRLVSTEESAPTTTLRAAAGQIIAYIRRSSQREEMSIAQLNAQLRRLKVDEKFPGLSPSQRYAAADGLREEAGARVSHLVINGLTREVRTHLRAVASEHRQTLSRMVRTYVRMLFDEE